MPAKCNVLLRDGLLFLRHDREPPMRAGACLASSGSGSTLSRSFCFLKLRGGSDAFGGAMDGDVESALADPEMAKVRAFMPRELHRTISETFGGSSFSLKSLLFARCWFYPLPPWGRKDVFHSESNFLQFWHVVMSIAICYVCAVEPFRAAGFAVDFECEKPAHDLNSMCKASRISLMDMLVNGVFLAEMCLIHPHTAYYKPLGRGKYVLIDDVQKITLTYVTSSAFIYDLIGILPFRGIFCLIARIFAFLRWGRDRGSWGGRSKSPGLTPGVHETWWKEGQMPPAGKDGTHVSSGAARMWTPFFVMLLDATRLFHLMRLHHFHRVWHYAQRRFPRRARLIHLAKLLVYLLFSSHILCCAWFWVGLHDPKGWISRQKYTGAESWYEKYVTSFYFVYSTMTTVGYGDISARTPLERFFCVWAMVCGSFLFGVLIGSVPAVFNTRSAAVVSYLAHEQNVKEYLHAHKVPDELRGRILQYYEYRFPNRRLHNVEDMSAQLPRSIQEALGLHLHQHLVKSCRILSRCCATTLADVCLRFKQYYAARGDVIINARSAPQVRYSVNALY